MEVSNNGLNIIKEFEGLRLKAYKCPAGVWTVGWGQTGPTIKAGTVITKKEAERLLKEAVDKEYGPAVLNALPGIELNQNEFDALVSLVYNIGAANFKKSTIKRMLLKGKKAEAASAFDMWTKAKGKVLPGLVRRRAAEKALFLKPVAKTPLEAPRKPVEEDSGLESRTVPQKTDKPLVASKEIAGGILLGGSGITQMVSSVDVNTLVTTKQSFAEVKSNAQEMEGLAFSTYVIQGASILIFLIGLFIIWKRYKDRKEGKR